MSEFQTMYSIALLNSKSITSFLTLNKNLFALLCCLVGHRIKEYSIAYRFKIDLYILYSQEFHYVMENISILYPTIQSGILDYFADRTWPSTFLLYIETVKSFKVPKTFMATNKNMIYSILNKQIAYFGRNIQDEYKMAQHDIQHHFNPYWYKTNEHYTAMLYSIRESYWPTRAWELARCRYQYQWRQNNPHQRFSVNQHLESINIVMINDFHKMDEQYYSTYWLSFVYLGLPSGQNCIFPYTLPEVTTMEFYPDRSILIEGIKCDKIHEIRQQIQHIIQEINQTKQENQENQSQISHVYSLHDKLLTLQLQEITMVKTYLKND